MSARPTPTDLLKSADRAIEIGVGKRPDLAVALQNEGVEVIATDIRERSVPTDVGFVQDDVTEPSRSQYEGADLLYARRLPPELHQPTARLARQVGAAFYFTTLGFEWPEIPAERVETTTGTWFVATERASEK